jgi:hypothetical protein
MGILHRKPHQNPPPPPSPNETGGNSKRLASLNSAFEMPTVNHHLRRYDMAGKLVLLRLSLAGNQEKSPKGGSVRGYGLCYEK